MTEETTRRFQAVPGMSVATAQLIELLKDGHEGDVLTDEEMTKHCGRTTQTGGAGYANLQTAIRYCTEHHGLVWKRINGANCIKCLGAQEIVNFSEGVRQHVHRVSKRMVHRLGTVSVESLPVELRKVHTLHFAQQATLSALSSKKTQKKLEVREPISPLDVTKMIEMWPSQRKAEKEGVQQNV